MSDQGRNSQLSLEDVLSELKNSYPAEYHEVRFVAEKIVSYFNRPPHEITIRSIKEALKLFPLYLSFERLPLHLIEILLKDADQLICAAEAIGSTSDAHKQLFYCEENCDVSYADLGYQVSRAFSDCAGNCESTVHVGSEGDGAINAIAEGAQSQ